MKTGKNAFGYSVYESRVVSRNVVSESIARVTAEHKTRYVINGDEGELDAGVRGKFHQGSMYPKVGDWVLYEGIADGKAVITEVLPRMSVVARKESEGDDPQVIAANVDLICIVQGLDNDFNTRRLERYLALAHQSGCTPFIILTKADLAEDLEGSLREARAVAKDVAVTAVNTLAGEGMDMIGEMLAPGKTAVLLGSSGAGKSTLVNYLLGTEKQRTGAVRGDDERGRHTTTHRELFLLANGAILIDTPGMRELGLLSSETDELEEVFEKVAALTLECRFTDCDHEKSAGCAVLAAIEEGTIDSSQFENYKKLSRERALRERFENKKTHAVTRQEMKRRQKE